jgi:hypothetical protein
MSYEAIIYLAFHALVTIGAIFTFFLRIEHRLTRVETKVENFEKRLNA